MGLEGLPADAAKETPSTNTSAGSRRRRFMVHTTVFRAGPEAADATQERQRAHGNPGGGEQRVGHRGASGGNPGSPTRSALRYWTMWTSTSGISWMRSMG